MEHPVHRYITHLIQEISNLIVTHLINRNGRIIKDLRAKTCLPALYVSGPARLVELYLEAGCDFRQQHRRA
jgi:hypothetical protein